MSTKPRRRPRNIGSVYGVSVSELISLDHVQLPNKEIDLQFSSASPWCAYCTRHCRAQSSIRTPTIIKILPLRIICRSLS